MGIKLELLGRVLAEDVAIQQPQALYESYSAPSYLPVYSNVLEPISFTPEITTPVFTKPIADPELIKQVFTPLPPPQHVEPDILTQQTPIIMEGIEDIFSLINNVSKTVSTVAPLFSSGSASSSGGGRSAPATQPSASAQQQQQQLLLQQQQAEQARLAKEKSDNTMLYVGLGVGGGLLLLGGGYLVLRNKKKSAGMGRVKKIKSTRKPVSRKSASKKKRKVKR